MNSGIDCRPLITTYVLVGNILGYETVIAMLISEGFSALSVAYYAGRYEFMTGFSTMNIDEIVRFDMIKVTWFSRIWLCMSSLTFYFVFLLTTMLMEEFTRLFASVVVLIVLHAVWAVVISTSRFKVSTSDNN